MITNYRKQDLLDAKKSLLECLEIATRCLEWVKDKKRLEGQILAIWEGYKLIDQEIEKIK